MTPAQKAKVLLNCPQHVLSTKLVQFITSIYSPEWGDSTKPRVLEFWSTGHKHKHTPKLLTVRTIKDSLRQNKCFCTCKEAN